MFLARVKGHVVATQKDPGIERQKLLIVEPLKVAYDDPSTAGAAEGSGGKFDVTGRAIIALDTLGAGEGELVAAHVIPRPADGLMENF